MKQSASRETSSYSASQEILYFLWEPQRSLPSPQQPATDPYPKPDASKPHLSKLFR